MYSTVRKQALYHETGMLKLGGKGGDFDRTVNPISTNGEDYAHHITTCPPRFSDFPSALIKAACCSRKTM